MDDEKKTYWLDDPKNVTLLVRVLYGVCGLLFVVGFFTMSDHVHFDWESWPAFYGIYGFLSFTFAVLVGKQLRKVLMRKEDYYDE